jgi:hypothetical protein
MAQVNLHLAGMLHDPGCANITATDIAYHQNRLRGTCSCPSHTRFHAMVPNTLMGRGIKDLAGFPPGWRDHNLIFAGRDISRENQTLSLIGGAQEDELFIRVAPDSPWDDNPEVQDAANAAAAAAAATAAAPPPAQGGGKRKYRRKKTKTRYRKRSSRKRKKRKKRSSRRTRRTRRTRLSRSRGRRK